MLKYINDSLIEENHEKTSFFINDNYKLIFFKHFIFLLADIIFSLWPCIVEFKTFGFWKISTR